MLLPNTMKKLKMDNDYSDYYLIFTVWPDDDHLLTFYYNQLAWYWPDGYWLFDWPADGIVCYWRDTGDWLIQAWRQTSLRRPIHVMIPMTDYDIRILLLKAIYPVIVFVIVTMPWWLLVGSAVMTWRLPHYWPDTTDAVPDTSTFCAIHRYRGIVVEGWWLSVWKMTFGGVAVLIFWRGDTILWTRCWTDDMITFALMIDTENYFTLMRYSIVGDCCGPFLPAVMMTAVYLFCDSKM